MTNEERQHPEIQRVEKLVKEFVNKLGEHCDAVRIFVAFPSPHGEKLTATYTQGMGNFYAQYGQIKHWVLDQEADVFAEANQRAGEDEV